MSEAKCETGWGDLSTRALFDAEGPSPHPDREFHSRSTLPLQGRVTCYRHTSVLISSVCRIAASRIWRVQLFRLSCKDSCRTLSVPSLSL